MDSKPNGTKTTKSASKTKIRGILLRLLPILVILTLAIGGTVAMYILRRGGDDEGRVAGFKVNITSVGSDFDSNRESKTEIEWGNNADLGVGKTYTFKIENKGEVQVKVTPKITGTCTSTYKTDQNPNGIVYIAPGSTLNYPITVAPVAGTKSGNTIDMTLVKEYNKVDVYFEIEQDKDNAPTASLISLPSYAKYTGISDQYTMEVRMAQPTFDARVTVADYSDYVFSTADGVRVRATQLPGNDVGKNITMGQYVKNRPNSGDKETDNPFPIFFSTIDNTKSNNYQIEVDVTVRLNSNGNLDTSEAKNRWWLTQKVGSISQSDMETFPISFNEAMSPVFGMGYGRSGTDNTNTDKTAIIVFTVKNVATGQKEDLTFTIRNVGRNGCVTGDTLVTLADGSQVQIRDLSGDELLLAWDMKTGKFTSAPILMLDNHGGAVEKIQIIHLYFDDGTDVKVVNRHGFFDMDSGQYIYIDSDNAIDYIGHRFNKQTIGADGEPIYTAVTLVDVVMETEENDVWSLATYGHLNFYVNGMLSVTNKVEPILNFFEVDTETMTYDRDAMVRDILTYGIFDWDSDPRMQALISKEMFDLFGGQFFRIPIAKGDTTFDIMYATVAALLEFIQLK